MQATHIGVLQKEFQARKRNIVEYAHYCMLNFLMGGVEAKRF
jgi:hypothetical protein